MNEADVIEQLKKQGLFDIEHKTSFVGYRTDKNGQSQKLQIDIFDSYSGDHRYSCVATTNDGKIATGNPAPYTDLAISNVHWWELDK